MSVTKKKNSLSAHLPHKEINPYVSKQTPYIVFFSSHCFLDPFDKNGCNSTFSPQKITETESTSQCLAYIHYRNEASAYILTT